MDILQTISEEFNLTPVRTGNIIGLIDEGNTIPFIARYRKEMTGGVDDQTLRSLFDRLTYLRSLEKRKVEVANAIVEQGKFTPQIEATLAKAVTLTEVEDIYRPYKQKRKTRASMAIAKGLQPLAETILKQDKSVNLLLEAKKYLTAEVKTEADAIAGASDIIAEIISDEAKYRKWIRSYFERKALLASELKDVTADEKHTYEMYYKYEEPIADIKSHRILALNRGEAEKVLKVFIKEDTEYVLNFLSSKIILNKDSISVPYVRAAVEDAYKRLIKSSIEREIRAELKANEVDVNALIPTEISADEIDEIIDSRDRRMAGITAVAEGLYLNRVFY